jgi:hypothetical protein
MELSANRFQRRRGQRHRTGHAPLARHIQGFQSNPAAIGNRRTDRPGPGPTVGASPGPDAVAPARQIVQAWSATFRRDAQTHARLSRRSWGPTPALSSPLLPVSERAASPLPDCRTNDRGHTAAMARLSQGRTRRTVIPDPAPSRCHEYPDASTRRTSTLAHSDDPDTIRNNRPSFRNFRTKSPGTPVSPGGPEDESPAFTRP